MHAPVRHIFFDTETTGKFPEKGDRLIEVGAVEYINGEFTGRQFHKLINPECEVHPEATRVHGYTWNDLKGKPVFRDVADEFLDFVKDAELYAHNADFDSKFMILELKRMAHPRSFLDTIVELHNTITLFRQLNPGERSYSLDNVLARLGISTQEREEKGHGAILDAHLLARATYTMQRSRPHRTVNTVVDENGNKREDVSYTLLPRDPNEKIYDYRNLPDRPPVQRVATLNKPLVAVQLNADELSAHNAYLARLRPAPTPAVVEAPPAPAPASAPVAVETAPEVASSAPAPSAPRFMRR